MKASWKMTDHRQKRERKYNLWGWLLFIISALGFMASSLKNHDPLALVASLFFLVACIVFLIPLVTRPGRNAKP